MDERSPLDVIHQLLSLALLGFALVVTIDQYDESHGGPGVKERVKRMLPTRKKVKRWEDLSAEERIQARRRMLIEAQNAANGHFEKGQRGNTNL